MLSCFSLFKSFGKPLKDINPKNSHQTPTSKNPILIGVFSVGNPNISCLLIINRIIIKSITLPT